LTPASLQIEKGEDKMGNNIAKLTPEQLARLQQLEGELGVIIIAYGK
jgi:hypothetical protein